MSPRLLGTILRILALALVIQVIWFCPFDCKRRTIICRVLDIYHKHVIQEPLFDATIVFLRWKHQVVHHLYRAAVYYAEILKPVNLEYSSELLDQ